MADFETGDIVRIGCVNEWKASEDIVNVLHLKIVSGGGLDFAAFAQDIQEYCDDLYATITTWLSTQVLDKYISIANITKDTVWGNIAWNAFSGGSSGTEPTAPQVALLAWGRTELSRVQIRKYLGVSTVSYFADGLWSSAGRALCQNYIDYHITQQTMGNGSVLQGVAWSPTYTRATTAVSGTTTAVPVIQRRRREGRGS